MISTLAKVFIVGAVLTAYGAGAASGALGTWHWFMQPEIANLKKENGRISAELKKAREESKALERNQARREREADDARQANVEALRDCKYPDDLRLRLEALAARTRDDSRYEESSD